MTKLTESDCDVRLLKNWCNHMSGQIVTVAGGTARWLVQQKIGVIVEEVQRGVGIEVPSDTIKARKR